MSRVSLTTTDQDSTGLDRTEQDRLTGREEGPDKPQIRTSAGQPTLMAASCSAPDSPAANMTLSMTL